MCVCVCLCVYELIHLDSSGLIESGEMGSLFEWAYSDWLFFP